MSIIKQDYGTISEGGTSYVLENYVLNSNKLITSLTGFFNYTPEEDCLIAGTIRLTNGTSAGYCNVGGYTVVPSDYSNSGVVVGNGSFGIFVPKGSAIVGYTAYTLYVYGMNV